MTIIDWMNQLLVHKKHWNDFTEDEQKKFSPFIINRWLSMDKDFIEIVNYFQKYAIGTLEPREVYKWYCDILPKGKRFNKYIKGKRDKKYNKELMDILVKYFECSKLHIKEYLEFLTKKDLETILIKYGNDEKTIKRLCKWK
jgi:hypothetical protein